MIAASLQFLDGAPARAAIEQALLALSGSMQDIRTLTYAGLDKGVPVLEAAASCHLPARIRVPAGIVHVKIVDDPVGCVLYAQA